MNKEEIQLLSQKFVKGTATTEEKMQLHHWYTSSLDEKQELVITGADEDHEAVKSRLYAEIQSRLLDGVEHEQVLVETEPVRVKLWPRIRIAVGMAAALAAVVFGVWFFNANLHGDKARHPSRYSGLGPQDIGPGKNGATLTLANGNVIQLSDQKVGVMIGNNKLAYNDGSEITSGVVQPLPEEMQNLTASTTKGQTYQFTLPDGTKVWLNADSKISFPSQFNGKERKILLSGEGYFEVAKDKEHPFIVASKGQTVTVLGTHFNINAYGDEPGVRTTLAEGSVEVATPAPVSGPGIQKVPGMRFRLVPDQQALYADGKIKIIPVDAQTELAWKEGKFVFEHEDIETIMRKLSRWYNVEIEYNSLPAHNDFSGSMSRFENISQVLRKIEMTNKVHFKVAGRRVTVMN